MARPRKTGLTYFYKDTSEWDDYRIIDLVGTFGPAGYAVYDVIRGEVYKNGYYLEISIEKLALLVIREIGNRWIQDKAFVREVVAYCGEIGLLDPVLLSQSVFTSKDIQQHYDEVTARSKADKTQYWLLAPKQKKEPTAFGTPEKDEKATKTDESSVENAVFTAKMQQSKVKQSKQNKSKSKQSKQKQSKTPPCPPEIDMTGAEATAAIAAAAAAAAAAADEQERRDISDRVQDDCQDIETAYYAVTGRRLTVEDRQMIDSLQHKGLTMRHMVQTITDVGRRNRDPIHSFRYFVPILRESVRQESRYSNENDGRYPPTYDTADIEAILTAAQMSVQVGPDEDYIYDD